MRKFCKRCKQPYPRGWAKELHERRSANIKAALAKTKAEGGRVGRKRTVDLASVYTLRDGGMSTQKIADTLRCSRGAIQYALKIRIEAITQTKETK